MKRVVRGLEIAISGQHRFRMRAVRMRGARGAAAETRRPAYRLSDVYTIYIYIIKWRMYFNSVIHISVCFVVICVLIETGFRTYSGISSRAYQMYIWSNISLFYIYKKPYKMNRVTRTVPVANQSWQHNFVGFFVIDQINDDVNTINMVLTKITIPLFLAPISVSSYFVVDWRLSIQKPKNYKCNDKLCGSAEMRPLKTKTKW